MPNSNHPPKGSSIFVDPIRSLDDIKAISQLLAGNPRNHLLWTIGINNGLRAVDLLRLKVKAVKNLKPGQSITIKETKTGKPNVLMINKVVYKSLNKYLHMANLDDQDFLFKSRKGNGPLQSQAVSKLVKSWVKPFRHLNGNYGAHTLRKTFGYIQRTVYGVGFEILCKRFNHSSPAITMRYLGIQNKEVDQILMNEIG